MSNADILREMTCIIAALCRIIVAQDTSLEQLGAVTMEEEKAAVAKKIAMNNQAKKSR